MTFEFSTDYPLIRRVLTEARGWRRMTNDNAPHVDAFEVKAGFVLYVLAFEGGMASGVFVMVPIAPGYAEVHFCLAPHTWGDAERIGRAFMAWVWEQTSLLVIYGPVPSYNRLALRLAKRCGFEECETFPADPTRDNKPFQIVMTKAARA